MSDGVLKLAFGGLTNLDENAINIRKHQIDNGHRLHSCFFYGESLDVIREAANRSGTTPQMSTKVYYNFRGNRSFKGIHNSIYGQLELIVERLGFIPKNWHVQICNITKIDPFTTEEFRKFKKKVESSFGQVYFFVESFIFFEKEIQKIIKSNLVDGVTFRDSAFESQSSQKMRDYLEKNAITYSTYKGLFGVSGAVGSGSQVLALLLNDTKINNPLDLNLSFLKSKIGLSHFNYAVVSVSSMEHYTDLITRLENVSSLSQKQVKLVTKLKQESHSRLSCIDDYGAAQKKTVSISYVKYLMRKIIHRIADIFNGKSWI